MNGVFWILCITEVGTQGGGLGGANARVEGKAGNDVTIQAKYENGIFRPLEEVAIEEGTVVEVHVPVGGEPPRRRSIKDLPFYGMWADRDDITDGVSYVNDLRDSPRG